ncbi:MAG: T9SS type A sorting domain-containing protein [Flavobacteriales bacterium]|nr:T9SS type A sorting domain-containing protein [Flavobacteriales bacterium]
MIRQMNFRSLLFPLLLLSTWQLRAQVNLIANGSFEETDPLIPEYGGIPCPSSGGQIQIADGWAPAYGTVDYYSTCSNNTYPNYGVPQNLLGFQDPRTGNAYGSFACYTTIWSNAREYLWRELESPLVANQRYYMEYYVSLSDSSNFAVSTLGAFFSSFDTRYLDREQFLTLEPQVEDTSESHPFLDKDEWMKISGTFTASGGEQYVTIGKFRDEADDPLILQVANNNPDRWDEAMYLIDDVSLTRVGDVGIEEPSASLGAYPNPCTDVLYLELPAAQFPLQITVMDVVGRSMETLHSVQGNRYAIDVSAWPSGVYLLRGADEAGRRFSTRVVKQ